MTSVPVSLDALISAVRTSAPDEPLAQLEEAARLRDDVGELTDALLGHFVDQARRGGCSWSQIGDALGVSKQAAQQRHTSRSVPSERYTALARQAASMLRFHRIIGAVELSLLILAAALIDTLTGADTPVAIRVLMVAVALVAVVQTLLHLVSILASRRLK